MPKAPKPAKIEAAFFDVDNTILRGSSSYLFGQAAFKKGFFGRKDLMRFAYRQFQFIWRGESAAMMVSIQDRALGLIEGHKVADLEALGDEVYNNYISKRLWPKTVQLAQEHIKAGREVWLVTATPKEIAEKIALNLGLTGALGTVIESKDGVFTGALVGKPLHGKAKRKAVKALAAERNISLKRSYAYSDSRNDLPLLTLVGHPVAVNPDALLKAHAKAAAWPILDFKKRELKANRALEVKRVKNR